MRKMSKIELDWETGEKLEELVIMELKALKTELKENSVYTNRINLSKLAVIKIALNERYKYLQEKGFGDEKFEVKLNYESVDPFASNSDDNPFVNNPDDNPFL
ncbi:hypothetical protein V7068_22250 [Bacillus sp. JJ634]